MQMSISLNNSTVLVLVNGKKFELTRTRTRNSNSTWLETRCISYCNYIDLFVILIVNTLSIRILNGFASRSRVHSSLNPRDYNTGPRPARPSFGDCPEYYFFFPPYLDGRRFCFSCFIAVFYCVLTTA